MNKKVVSKEKKMKTTPPVPATPVKEPAMKMSPRHAMLILEIGMMEVTVKAVAKIVHAQYANNNAQIVGMWGNRPPKEKKMKIPVRYLSLVLAIASALDVPDTTVYTPWNPRTRPSRPTRAISAFEMAGAPACDPNITINDSACIDAEGCGAAPFNRPIMGPDGKTPIVGPSAGSCQDGAHRPIPTDTAGNTTAGCAGGHDARSAQAAAAARARDARRNRQWEGRRTSRPTPRIQGPQSLTPEAREARAAKAAAKAVKAVAAKAAQALADREAVAARAAKLEARRLWRLHTAPKADKQTREKRRLRRLASSQAALGQRSWRADVSSPVATAKARKERVHRPVPVIVPAGPAEARRLARWAKSPWGRAKAEAIAKREEARNARRKVRQARLAEDRAIRLSREEARAKKAAQKAVAKLAPKKGNAKRAYMAAIPTAPAPTATQLNRTIRCVAKVDGKVVARQVLTAKQAVAYLEEQGYKPIAAPVPTAANTAAKTTAPVAPVAPRVVAEATPTHALKIATAAKADAVIAEFFNGKVKLFTVATLQAMVTDGVYDLAGNLNPDQKAALWAERQARQNRVKTEKVDKVKGAKAMFLKANPVYAEFKANQNPKYKTMGYKMATVTQEESK